jgi:hypothetical protein
MALGSRPQPRLIPPVTLTSWLVLADVQEAADALVGRWRAATAARAHRRPERPARALPRPSGVASLISARNSVSIAWPIFTKRLRVVA